MTGHIFIYGNIGTGVGEISVNNVKSQLDPLAEDYVLHVISLGGDVFEGFGIYNLLKNVNKPITAHIEGVCASIATLCVGAADTIIMNKTSQFMIHNPQISSLRGDANVLRNVADQLDKIKTLLIDVYVRRTGLSKEKLWDLYDKETWLNAADAKQMRFVDEVQDAIKAVAKADITNFIANEMENKEQDGLMKRILNFFKHTKITNEVTETLEDGRVIVIMADGDDWSGKQIMLETGGPLEPGDYKLASGKTITVGDGSTVTKVSQPAEPGIPEPEAEKKPETPPAPQQTKEEMDKIKELEHKLAEANARAQAAETARAHAVASSAKFENRLEKLESQLLETVGDKTPVPKGPGYINLVDKDNRPIDPMGEDALVQLRATNRI